MRKEGVGWAAPMDEIVPFREEISPWEMAASCTCEHRHSPCCGLGGSEPPSDSLSLAGGQRRAPALLGRALAGGGHRQLGPGLWGPQHARRLHQRPCLPQLDLRRPEGQCRPADTAAATRRFWGAVGVVQGPLIGSAQRGTAPAGCSIAAGWAAGMGPLGSAQELSQLPKLSAALQSL